MRSRKKQNKRPRPDRKARAPGQNQAAASPMPAWARVFDASRYPVWIRLFVAIFVLGISMLFSYVMFFFLLFGVVLILPLERVFKRNDQPILRPELAADFMHVFVSAALAAIPTYFIALAVSNFQVQVLASRIASQPLWLQGTEAFFVRELIIYWAHRIAHQVPLLWRFHSVHHSSKHLDWIAAQRRHPVDSIYIATCSTVVMALSGFSAAQLGILAALSGLWDTTIHANINWRLKWLDGIWVTQEFHHWHHVKDRSASDNNYAGAFAFYDLLFGTYYMPKDRRPGDYGIQEQMPPNYLGQLTQPFLPARSNPPPADPPTKA